jgi:large subunit ribosomal protein L3
MGKWSTPRRGSMMFKRNRASSEIPRIRSWPDDKDGILGFAAYKAGITHAIIIETNKKNRLAGKEVKVPVTILECPPMVVVGFRGYRKTPYGIKVAGEVWAEKMPKYISRTIKIRKKGTSADQLKKFEKINDLFYIRLITSMQPDKVSAVPKKAPEIMEQAVGGTLEQQLAKAKELLGKDLNVADVFKAGDTVDIFAVSKGHGFQGVVKRMGVKLQKRKAETKRKIATLGPVTPSRVLPTVPMAGQMGYHQRFSLNHVILKLDQVVVPKGGWPNYGVPKNNCIIVKGSLPGSSKRLIRMRKSIRWDFPYDLPEITHLSLEAKN